MPRATRPGTVGADLRLRDNIRALSGDTMAKKRRIPNKLQPWIEARKRYRLSHAHIQMARELGMSPKKLGGLANRGQQPWKLPLPQYIEQQYQKRFDKPKPDDVRSIEQRADELQRKKEQRRARKQTGGDQRTEGQRTELERP